MAGHKKSVQKLRIGIYAGAFDPVHAGHVALALQALDAAKLDEVIFLPERRPRSAPGVEHYAHRIAMLKKALLPHPSLSVMETVDPHNSICRTLPQLRGLFPDAVLSFLMGSDTALTVPDWPHANRLLEGSELIVGVGTDHESLEVETTIRDWDVLPAGLTMVNSFAPDVSSDQVRQALRSDQHTKGLLVSVRRYARQEWLYVTPGNITA